MGATVTLLRSDTSAGPFEQVPDGSAIMSPSNRTNPDVTDATGHFGWDVIAGYYTVRAEATGCVSPTDPGQSFVETPVLTIPPPVTDLDIRLDCDGVPPPVMCEGSLSTIEGTAGPDVIVGTDGSDVISGLGGNDEISGLGGNDIICGDDGNDLILGNAGHDRAYGGAGNDVIRGASGQDTLSGQDGDDQLYGESGRDSLNGGLGTDRCNGGNGNPDVADVSCERIQGVP